jgi:hypothetical protein
MTNNSKFNKKQLSRNYTRKQYERAVSDININLKHNSSKKEHAMRKLDASNVYDDLRDKMFDETTDISVQQVPKGLLVNTIQDENLLNEAKNEVKLICDSIRNNVGEEDEFTNYRFYINAPYFDRGRGDPFPLYRWNDSRVKSLCQLIDEGLKVFGKEYNELLNVIIRVYRAGDILNFHTDRIEFGDVVYGVILSNEDPSRGLILTKKNSTPFMMNETSGTVWALTDESRFDYEHGYCSNFNLNEELLRISITFRFFSEKRLIPKKEFEE